MTCILASEHTAIPAVVVVALRAVLPPRTIEKDIGIRIDVRSIEGEMPDEERYEVVPEKSYEYSVKFTSKFIVRKRGKK